MERYYIITYVSAVTGNNRSVACKSLKEARKEKKALEKDGAKDVKIIGIHGEHI